MEKPRVLMVSTYPPTRCGVAYYTQSLVRHLKNYVDVVLLTDREWRRNDPLLPLKILRKSKGCEVVHIQHEFYLYGGSASTALILLALALLRLKRLISKSPKSIVMTLHSVPRPEEFGSRFSKGPRKLLRSLALGGYRLLTSLPDVVLVHTPASLEALGALGARSRILLLPHGVEPKEPPEDARKLKERLNKNLEIRLLAFGFLSPNKDYETLVKALKLLPENFKLYIRGGSQLNEDSVARQRLQSVLALAEKLGVRERVFVELGFVDKDRAFKEADVVLLPYTRNYGASGVLCDAVSYGKLFLPTNIPHFKSLLEAYGWRWFAEPRDPKSLADALKDLLASAEDALAVVRRLQQEWSWDRIAKRTVEEAYELRILTRKN
jgi:glycosyltransferase involved in cell wall biosynthesis